MYMYVQCTLSMKCNAEGFSAITDSELSEEEEEEEGEEEEEEEEEEGEGTELLVAGKTVSEVCRTEEGFSGVAAVAEQFQPKGITLATTEV